MSQGQFEWATIKIKGTHHDALLCNGIAVAYVFCSGGWGWAACFLDGLRPSDPLKYYKKKETAMRNAEKRFNVSVKYN